MADYREVINGCMTVARARKSTAKRQGKLYLYVNVLVYGGPEAKGEPVRDLEYDYRVFRSHLAEAAQLAHREFPVQKEK